jgi:cellulose synthase (UDP-forming)
MLLMYALPIYAMLIGEQIVNVNYIDFIWHSLPTSIALILIVAGWRRNGWLRPYDAKVFGWEGLLLQFARWPWVLAGSVAAVKDRVTGTFVDYRITPKGSDAAVKVPWRVLTPYIGLATLSALPVTLLSEVGSANGYFIFAIINTCIYLTLVAVILFAYAIENVRGWQRWIAVLKAQVVVASIALLIAVLPIREKMARGVEALTWQSEWLAFTEERYVVSGAGVPGTRLRKIRFRSLWQSNDTKSRK